MNTNSNTPLYKNEAKGYYEAIYKGHHIVVTFEEFEEALESRAQQRLEIAPGQGIQGARDAAFFDLIEAAAWDHEVYWHTEEAKPKREEIPDTSTWQVHFGVHIHEASDEAALERMAEYFYGLYQKAEDGSPQEARYASVYGQIMSALTRRETTESLIEIERELSTLCHTMGAAIGAIVAYIAAETPQKKEGDTDARTDTATPASQL